MRVQSARQCCTALGFLERYPNCLTLLLPQTSLKCGSFGHSLDLPSLPRSDLAALICITRDRPQNLSCFSSSACSANNLAVHWNGTRSMPQQGGRHEKLNQDFSVGDLWRTLPSLRSVYGVYLGGFHFRRVHILGRTHRWSLRIYLGVTQTQA